MHPPQWGYDNADVSVQLVNESADGAEAIGRALRAHPAADHVARTGGVYAVPAELPRGAGVTGLHVTFLDGDMDRIGYETIEGRNPAAGTEIALGVRAAELLGKRVGDVVGLYIQGRKADYTVTGIYQSIANRSLTARLTSDGIARLGLDEEPSAPLFFVRLGENADPEAFIAELRGRFGDAIYAASQETLVREAFGQALGLLVWPLGAMGLFILGVACGITYSVSRLQVRRDGWMLAMYRALGMTAGRLRLAILSGTAPPAIAGAAAGLTIGAIFTPHLLDAALRSYGLADFPAVRDAGALAAAAAACCAAMLLGTWLASGAITRQPVRPLPEEA
ncbi:MAG: hypothetical protein A9Z00_00395 [Thermobacillus sp. ZCTH02-B1]|uniref:FtsX-like permease family protein n=1 Tax=Thermobacillus sp. ZCTH02-B1 TaxID=1858795 RepID=UPI000B572833|nr:MAG: hypothetical protein A9Z00_00395 [Thermobacillus sp. ZCTH02-B1]